ncbi:hypothetical protein LIER_15472 [Lithospermum erythrorhizon]|uniref:Uncharacterized protein n=1 Tax=Lithospermum erythrorhizon TaxID=34254 RepID=A0AAV3Q4K2_LITER
MLVPPLGQESGRSKKRGQENHPEVMYTRSEIQKENDDTQRARRPQEAGPPRRDYKDSMYKLVKQKKRTFSEEKIQAVRTKIDLLLKAGAIGELQFQNGLQM